MYKYLDTIHSPDDVKKYNDEEMKLLAAEIREFLISEVPKTGGHLASNLGVVELTLALYKVFSAPQDKIIFDVGHQAYVSKILTGRKEQFSSLRCENGISGFPKMSESEYDAFGTGHSSTALSAALGIATANKLSGNDSYTVAVVGDGAFSGGLVYEALNNCSNNLRLVVILNENEMSISKSVGNMAHMISGIRSKENYFKIKNATSRIIDRIPLVGKPLVSGMRKAKKALKSAIFSANIVEKFGFTYYGPIDGNDYETVERLIAQAKKHGGSAFIHVKTLKGKGFAPAEQNPSGYHMVKPEGCKKQQSSFSSEFGEYLTECADKNEKVCAITAAMMDGTGLCSFFEKYPRRAFDVGIAEGHAVTFAAGLSTAGYTPVFAVYSSFLQRSYDNIIHDVALQRLHCVLAIDRAGLSPDDGATHHGIFDVSMLSQVDNTIIYSPVSYESLRTALLGSISENNGIYAVRYPKGEESTDGLIKADEYVYTDDEYSASSEVAIVTYGRIFTQALAARKMLCDKGISCSVTVLEKIKPFEKAYENIKKYCGDAKKIVLLEEGAESGGFAQNIQNIANSKKDTGAEISVLAIKGEIPGHASLETLYRTCGISAEDIVKEVCGSED